MLINADFKGLEWYCAVFLSKDKVGYKELYEGADIHGDNQARFGLPNRLTAKKFVFRLLYGGSAFSYANDADFTAVSTSEKYWQKVIDAFYQKYKGIHQWHTKLVQTATVGKAIQIPSGRSWKLPYQWRTKILNYPVQGFGADLAMVARIEIHKALHTVSPQGLMLATVHDSILLDVPKEDVHATVNFLFDVWENLPKSIEEKLGFVFDLPTRVEVKVGNDWLNMEEVKRDDSH